MMKNRLRKIKQKPEYQVYSHKSGTGLLSCMMQLLLLYVAVLGTVLCVSTSLAMNISVVEIILLCLLTTVLAAAACYNKISASIAGGIALICVPLLWSVWQSFAATLQKAVLFCYDLAFVIMKMKGWDYTGHMLTDEENILQMLEDEMLVMSYFRSVVVVLAVFYAFWYVALAWKRPRVWLPVSLSLAVLVPGFMIGLVPSSVAFSMVLAAAFGLYIQTLPSKHLRRISFKDWLQSLVVKQDRKERFAYTIKSGLYGICTAGVSLVIMLIVALFTVRTPLIELDQIRQYLDEGSRYIYNQVFYSRLETPENAIGNMLKGENISVLDIPNIHHVPVLYVTSQKNEDVYLRAWVSDSLTKEGWSVIDEQDDADFKRMVLEGVDPYFFAYRLHMVFVDERFDLESQYGYGFEVDTLEIKARFKKSLVVHLPSYGVDKFTEPLSEAEVIGGEVLQFKDKRPVGNIYEMQALLPIITSKGYVGALHGLAAQYRTLLSLDTSDIQSKNFQNFKKDERSYYEYAKKHYLNYTGLPISFQNKAKELTQNNKSQLTKVLAIEKYFRDNTKFTYTLKPEQLQDATIMQQLEYSLNTKYEGYCSYYATAMVMMVRSLGYPARFVNGYYMSSTNNEPNGDGEYRRVVMDEDCHAWVEVYFDGLGWMTFDPTPDTEETAEEFNSRYYAIELEQKGGDKEGNQEQNSGPGAVISVAEQPEDDEVMPSLMINYGIFGGLGLAILIIIVVLCLLALAVVLVVMLYVKAQKHAKQCYESVNAPDENGALPDRSLQVRRMHRLILRWLELKNLTRQSDEDESSYAQRVDQTLKTQNSYAALLGIFEKSEFSDDMVVEEQLQRVSIYYNELYQLLNVQKGKLPWWKKIKI